LNGGTQPTERNYDAYRPDVAEALIVADNAIDNVERELKDLREQREKVKNNPEELKSIGEVMRYKEAELARFEQDREDILRGYE
jgi:hypothetical protein